MFQRNIAKKVLSTIDTKDELIEKDESLSNKNTRKTDSRNSSIYWRYITLILLVWVSLIHYYERSVVKRAMKQCSWEKWEKWPKDATSHKVGLFADPQIMDNHSYPGRPAVINYITQVILDNYHRKNWKYAQYYLDPNTSFFLGDLFDGGRYWDDDYWHKEFKRFNDIFPKKSFRKTVMSLPGNHDIGFGDTVVESSLERFQTYFGESSSSHNIGNHTIVLLDTISLSDTKNSNISSIPKEFLRTFSEQEKKFPSILLTHVPLWRDPHSQSCGSQRESKKPFPMMKGVQYQTVIDQELSQEILKTIQPELLFSGDDHDYCRITHTYQANGEAKTADEITVKSCAMNMGISKPAIQLLSLYNPENTSSKYTYQTSICYLPDPYKPLIMYGATAFLSLTLMIFIHFYPAKFNNMIIYRMEKTFNKDHSYLPLPVTSSGKFENLVKVSAYMVNETINLYAFLINVFITIISVLVIFVYYFSNI